MRLRLAIQVPEASGGSKVRERVDHRAQSREAAESCVLSFGCDERKTAGSAILCEFRQPPRSVGIYTAR